MTFLQLNAEASSYEYAATVHAGVSRAVKSVGQQLALV